MQGFDKFSYTLEPKTFKKDFKIYLLKSLKIKYFHLTLN